MMPVEDIAASTRASKMIFAAQVDAQSLAEVVAQPDISGQSIAERPDVCIIF
jgi:hypothetical protein